MVKELSLPVKGKKGKGSKSDGRIVRSGKVTR